MKRLLIAAALILLSTSSADIDLVCRDDVPYIIWSMSDKPTFLLRATGGFKTVFLGYHTNVSLAIISIGSTDYLAAACTHFDPWMDPSRLMVIETETLDVLNSREIFVDDLGFQAEAYSFDEIHLEKHSSGSDSCLIICSTRCCVVTDQSYYPVYLGSCFVDFTETGSIILYDTLSTMIHDYAGTLQASFGPFSTQDIRHLSVSAFCTACPMSFYHGRISSHLHQIAPASKIEEMWSHGIYTIETYGIPFDLGLVGAGSNSAESIALWEDTSSVLQYSVFTDSIAPDVTYEFPFDAPDLTNPVAMSCNPEDPGLLLVWFDSILDQIRVRHYQDEWNDFDHVIASCPSGVSQGNIAVYSVADGYYVAWLPGSQSPPELVFVDRATVTGISDRGESSLISPVISISSNPFTECVSFTVENDVSIEELLVFDMSGRVVFTLQSSDDGTFHWDGCSNTGSTVSSGVYFILGTGEKGIVSAGLVKL